ncbi:MAG: hypothetical protein AMXMBFR6_10320 [Betaproteobacteria bacterium]
MLAPDRSICGADKVKSTSVRVSSAASMMLVSEWMLPPISDRLPSQPILKGPVTSPMIVACVPEHEKFCTEKPVAA